MYKNTENDFVRLERMILSVFLLSKMELCLIL